jgi:hypothetical protein
MEEEEEEMTNSPSSSTIQPYSEPLQSNLYLHNLFLEDLL